MVGEDIGLQSEAIVQSHLVYLEAGAQCIITSSYQASLRGLTENGYDRAAAESLILKSVKLAEDAIKQFAFSRASKQGVLIAASIGPYGAYLADGSEYRGNYGISNETLLDFHRFRFDVLERTNADLFACETIPSFQEAKVLAQILRDTRKSAWFRFRAKTSDAFMMERQLRNVPHFLQTTQTFSPSESTVHLLSLCRV